MTAKDNKTPKPLRAGMKFTYERGDTQVYEVVRVSPCSATCKPIGSRQVQIRDVEGNVTAEFTAPGALFHISPFSTVVEVEDVPRLREEADTASSSPRRPTPVLR